MSHTSNQDNALILKAAYKYIVPKHGTKWKKIGKMLGQSTEQLDMIKEEFQDCYNKTAECCNAVISRWLDTDTSAGWEKLNDVIESLSKPTKKQKITQKSKQPTQQSTPSSSPQLSGTKRTSSDNGEDNSVKCICGGDTSLLIAEKPKDVRNHGKRFYKCSDLDCKYRKNFFQWEDSEEPLIWCNCKKPKIAVRVRRSYGLFYACCKSATTKCDFFCWIERNESASQGLTRSQKRPRKSY
ncbi:uncharacterized protein [Dysidea avara]|uniref:uncharacterized protein isoform X2 n=1 Tax=Dysidea avara TaxID=196820 RepID=UPI0033186B4F